MEGGGDTRGIDQSREPIEAPGLQSLCLLDRPSIVIVVVDGPEDRPVFAPHPQGGDCCAEILLGHLVQKLLTEMGGHSPISRARQHCMSTEYFPLS